jgi:hypothetical protein
MSPPQDRIVKIRDLVFQPGSFFSSWGCSTLRQIKCLLAACTCALSSSCSSHSGTPTRTHWTGRSGSRWTSWGRSEISGARSPGSLAWSLWPRQPQKFPCSRTPPSMGGAPMWARGSVREGHVDRGGVSSLHQYFGDEGCHSWRASLPVHHTGDEVYYPVLRQLDGRRVYSETVCIAMQQCLALCHCNCFVL